MEVEAELAEPEPAAVALALPESEQEPVTDEELSNAVASAAVSAYERELMSLGLGELSADLFGVTPLADAEKARPVANVRPERRAPEPVSEPASLDVPPTETETTAPDEAIDLSALLESLDRTQDETPPISDESPALDELGSVELEELESEDLPQAGPAPSEPETVEMAAEPLSAEMSYDGIGLSGGMTDELSALTGADRPARPVVSVSRIPDRGSGVLDAGPACRQRDAAQDHRRYQEPVEEERPLVQSVKVVITGPFNAGKTSLIKAVSEITVLSTERQVSGSSGEGDGETTVAMDFGRITVSEDVVLYLFGTPGQARFSFMWETLSEGMLGFVLLVDAADPSTFEDARDMIDFFTSMSDVPFVVAANKVVSDDTEALRRVREDLKLPEAVPLLAVDARSRDSVKTVLLGLLYEILKSME